MLPYERSAQILRVLAEHGPLSVRGLHFVLQPSIKPRRLRDALQRLTKKGFVALKLDNMFSGRAVYYRITHDKRTLDILKNKYGITPPPDILPRELFHSEGCALWAETFKRLLPGATVIRDFRLVQNNMASELLLLERDDLEAKPDLLIMWKPNDSKETLSVAVEFERTKKSDERLIRKISKYSNQTRLDGVIYICADDAVSDRIRMIYASKVLQRAQRIEHYGEHFFMFSDCDSPVRQTEFRLLSSFGKNISLLNWMNVLAANYMTARRDSQFEYSASSG